MKADYIVQIVVTLTLFVCMGLIAYIAFNKMSSCTYHKGEIAYCANTRQ